MSRALPRTWRPLTRRPLLVLVLVAAITACSPAATPETPETSPPLPTAPTGWRSVGSMRGSGGAGWLSAEFVVSERPTVLAATCIGNGTLVIASASPRGGPSSEPTPAFVLACGAGPDPAVGRVAIADLMPVPDVVTVRAGVVDDPGSQRHPAFVVSVEQAP